MDDRQGQTFGHFPGFPSPPPVRVPDGAVVGVEVAPPGVVVDFDLLPDWRPRRARYRVVDTPRGLFLLPPDTEA